MMEFERDRASEVSVIHNEEITYPTAFHLASTLLPLAQRKLAEAKENGPHMDSIRWTKLADHDRSLLRLYE